jgi:hypothetical protein
MADSDLVARIQRSLTKEVVFAFALGAVVGLVVLGWWLFPVRWTDADPADLRDSQKAAYLQLVADSYALTGDSESAGQRLQSLLDDPQGSATLQALLDAQIKARLQDGRADEALRLQGLAAAALSSPATIPSPTEEQPSSSAGSNLQRVVGIAFFLLLLGAGVLLLLTQLQKREAVRRRRTPTTARHESPVELHPGPSAPPSEQTLEQFETTYDRSYKEYDVSTSVQSAGGEFVGECGVSAIEEARLADSEGIGGFEIWLFDKDDVRTEAKVLLSEACFRDGALREQLAHKGEIVQPQLGQALSVQTANLRLDATITELEFEGDDNAAFARLSTRLVVAPT